MANGRIRTVKPEFFRSPDTASVSPRARLLYIALWCWADDYGIGETNLNGLLGFAFPDDDQMERKELQSLCKEVADGYKVLFYEVRGRHFYAIPSWDDHQKTQRRANCRNPKPDDPDSVPDLRFCNDLESSVSSQGTSLQLQGETPSGTGEQGNRGTGEQEPSTASLAGSRKKPSVPIPDDWVPNESHRARALGRGMDVDALADEMRNWALSKDDRKANWDAAFTNWINRADVKPSNAVRRVIAGGLWEGD